MHTAGGHSYLAWGQRFRPSDSRPRDSRPRQPPHRSVARPAGGAISFGQHPRGLRAGPGLSRAERARRAAVRVSTLRNWEGDRGFPHMPALLRLAGAPGVLADGALPGLNLCLLPVILTMG
jgi:Helix-turn-helix domain